MYRGRLFAAGDAANPDRLYYSVLPGSGRTVEQWGAVEASPAVEGGHVEIGALGGDPIVAVRALSNQLLIFKKNSLYRLFGDRPSNYTVEHIDTEIPQTNHAAVAVYGDMLYFGTQNGLYYYNGVTASLGGYALHKSLYGNGGSFRLPHKNRSRQAVFHFSAQRKGRNDRI